MRHLSPLFASVVALLTLAGCSVATDLDQGIPPTAVTSGEDKSVPVLDAQWTIETDDTVPPPVGTVEYLAPTPGITPTRPEPTITPTPAVLEPARLVTASIVSTVTEGLDLRLSVQSVISSTEPVISLVWSPYGDGFVYATILGNVFWTDLTGANRTLLYTYSDEYFDWSMFEHQRPTGSTMYIVHQGEPTLEGRLPGHMDMVRFAPGQIPTFEHMTSLPLLWGVEWWRPDRASGVLLASYMGDGYVGGDRIVTLDGDGRIVDDRNIPYMLRGVVQPPNGEWLAYGTNQQATLTSFEGSEPSTAYLLNLRTGERLQISPAGNGGVSSWSPDGNWLITGCGVLSADQNERVCMPGWLGGDMAWSPDSKRLATSIAFGGCEPEGCAPYGSEFFVVDLPSRKVARYDADKRAAIGVPDIRRPRWSPDGSLLAVLAFSPGYPGSLPAQNQPSGSPEPRPAIYLLAIDSGK
jgi:WD40 repeat protein